MIHPEAMDAAVRVRIAKLEAENARLRKDAKGLHEAYLRLRGIIPGAWLTPTAPSAETVWQVTEDAAKALVARIAKLEAARAKEEGNG